MAALLQEEEGGLDMGGGMGTTDAPPPSALDNIPLGSGDTPDGELNVSMGVYEFNPKDFNIDLETLHLSDEEKQEAEADTAEVGGEDADLGGEEIDFEEPGEEPDA